MDPFERAEDQLVDDLNAGRIIQRDFDDEMREMRYAYQAQAEEEARRAYEDTMRDWGC